MTDKRLSAQITELRDEVELLRLQCEGLTSRAALNAVLRPIGVEVLAYEGPAFYDLGRVVQCELCGELVEARDLGYELRLLSRTWGPRYGYVHKGCFSEASGEE